MKEIGFLEFQTPILTANAKFLKRFAAMEKIIKARDLDMSEMDLNALNEIWDEAKNDLAD